MASHELSFWGWGYAHRFASLGERGKLGLQLRLALGISSQTPRRPARLKSVELAEPRIAVPEPFRGFCSGGREDRIRHTYGRAYPDLVRGFQGDFSPAPDLVAYPRREEDISELLDWASGARVAVIPYGGGTSVVGGVEGEVGDGFDGVLSLDLRGLDRVLEVDPVSRAARIQAGATGPGLEAQLAEHGLTLRHYPQSYEFSTLGGWIATRSGGHYATLKTHIDDFVESTRMLTPAGVLESRRLPASGAGPSPDRLVMGSEGILGVITEAWMRLQERPRFRSRAQLRFSDWKQAVQAARAIAQAGLHPANCRLLDRREARLHRVVDDDSHVLILAFESAQVPVREALEQAMSLAQAAGGRSAEKPVHREEGGEDARTDADGRWRRAFFDAPYLQTNLVSLGVIADTFETACTWDRFEDLHETVVAAVRDASRRVCGRAAFVSCRFTHVYPDGPAPYYTFIAPGRRGAEIEQWQQIKGAASAALLDQGATITHHHAVGRVHRPWYAEQSPKLFRDALAATKGRLDPAGILNPGVLLPATGPSEPGQSLDG